MDNNNNTPHSSQQHSYVLNGVPVYEDGSTQAPKHKKPRKKRSIGSVLSVVVAVAVLISRIYSLIPTRLIVIPDGETFGSTVSKSVFDYSGDNSSAILPDADSRGTVHYSQMEYIRQDVDAIFAKIDHIEKVCFTLTYEEIVPLLDEVYTDYWNFDTMYSLADVKSCADVTDEYYLNECLYLGEQYPLLDQKIDEMLFALAASPLASQLDADYYGGDYLIYYTGESTYNDTLVELFQKESELIYEYQTIMGAATVEIDGETVYVDTYLSENFYNDDKYYECLELYYEKYGVLAGEIYIELVQTRHQIADVLGYDSYIDYAYESYERDYTPEDVREYIRTVCSGMVPLYLDLYNSGELYDYYSPGELSPGENKEALKSAVTEMGGEVYDIFTYMETFGLYDISVSEVKADMSFQSYFEDWSAPYIMIDATGTLDDYVGFAHEFGHFIDGYINYNTYITIDASEACSQSMEFLAVIHSSALGEDSGTVTRMKMIDVVTLYAEQGAHNAFEEAVYALPPEELTPEKLREIAHNTFIEYGMLLEGDHEMYDYMWIDIPHFFSNPFYIASYIIANDAALQIYEQELTEPGRGVETFLLLADRNWDLNYLENLEAIGLDASFSTERANEIVNSIYAYFE